MTQISRPFQVVLAVFAVFVVVWFAALRNHALSTGAGAGSSPAVVKPAKPVAKPAVHATSTSSVHTTGAHTQAGHTTVVHASRHTTSVPTGRGHAATVNTTVHRTVVVHTPTHTTSRSAAAQAQPAHAKPTPAKPTPAKPTTQAKPTPAKALSPQAQVQAQLQAGKTVLILFWNPHGAEDAAVHGELPAVQRKLGGKIAVHYATAGQVGEYGTVTHSVQVNQTPTLLIVNPHGQATVLTGLTDAFAIDQAIGESNRQQ